MTFLLSNKNIV